jgi:uncharacterized protein
MAPPEAAAASVTRSAPPGQFMLVPSLGCQASCAYCFGPNRGPVMSLSVLKSAIAFIEKNILPQPRIDITFHGGEPLLAGLRWYEKALPLLQDTFGSRLRLHLQSNLWRMDAPMARLFSDYHVHIGTSLDGPKAINDVQRGSGYFDQTMKGIKTARSLGLDVGVVCTFTAHSAYQYRAVCDFFGRLGLAFSVHGAVAKSGDAAITLAPTDHERLFCALFSYYMKNITHFQITTLDQMALGLAKNRGLLCSFSDCRGSYMAIAPDGGIYPCNRFVQKHGWRMGNVIDRPSILQLQQSSAWQRLDKQAHLTLQHCGSCHHFAYCMGGCPYHAIFAGKSHDPFCPGYRKLFDSMETQLAAAFFSKSNLTRMAETGKANPGSFSDHPLIKIIGSGEHPKNTAARARQTLAAAALGISRDPDAAIAKLGRLGLVTDSAAASGSVAGLVNSLRRQVSRLANLYLHITDVCNLACLHCYDRPPATKRHDRHLPVETIADSLQDGTRAGFKKIIITGGEPFCHPHIKGIMEILAARTVFDGGFIRRVLRTNLCDLVDADIVRQLPHAFDEIVVSIDGSRRYHDRRRGRGTYDKTTANLSRLKSVWPDIQLTLAATFEPGEQNGPEGISVRDLARSLGVGIRFGPLLPLGAAAGKPVAMGPLDPPQDEALSPLPAYLPPSISCGLGTHLSVSAAGEIYPCHALSGKTHCLGHIKRISLTRVVKSQPFKALGLTTVDHNRQCARCALRYLCGGYCRAWRAADHPDAPPLDCSNLHQRARKALEDALRYLGISQNRWQQVGLPWPDHPPLHCSENRKVS